MLCGAVLGMAERVAKGQDSAPVRLAKPIGESTRDPTKSEKSRCNFDLKKFDPDAREGGTIVEEIRGYNIMDRPCVVCGKSLEQFSFTYIAGGEVDNITPYLRAGSNPGKVEFRRLKRLWICPQCWKEIPSD